MQEAGLRQAQYVLDPVFLHSKEYYSKWEHEIHRKGYILIYIMEKNKLLSDAAKQLSQKTNKPIIELGGFRSKCKSDYFDKAAGPCEFLSYLKNADYVLTSSFHGTAFSLIYQKQFVCVLPNKNTLRLMNILESSGTTNRVLSSGSSVFDIVDDFIDYNAVEKKMNSLIKSSKEFLSKSLKALSVL